MYITVEGASYARTGEHVSLRVAIFNFWDEDMDVLLTVPASDDYQFVELDLDSGGSDLANPVDGTHQVSHLTRVAARGLSFALSHYAEVSWYIGVAYSYIGVMLCWSGHTAWNCRAMLELPCCV